MFPVINVFRCNGCGICVQRCPAQIMGLINGRVAYHRMLCEECGICAEVCPTKGIHFELPKCYGSGQVHEAYHFTR
jgi:NAD-dependent dihydropyrimidine dehydrogenase PreA subunit